MTQYCLSVIAKDDEMAAKVVHEAKFPDRMFGPDIGLLLLLQLFFSLFPERDAIAARLSRGFPLLISELLDAFSGHCAVRLRPRDSITDFRLRGALLRLFFLR